MTDEEIISDMLDHDFVVCISPERRYLAELEVKKVEENNADID